MTDLPPRQPSPSTNIARTDELHSRAFEPGIDGELPRVRIMRRKKDSTPPSEVHVTAVIGDLIEQFQSTSHGIASGADGGGYRRLTRECFFTRQFLGTRVVVGWRCSDDLSRAVAKAVGFAAGRPDQEFRERYSFDPTAISLPSGAATSEYALACAGLTTTALPRGPAMRHSFTLLDFYSVRRRQASSARVRQSRPAQRRAGPRAASG